MNPYNHKYYESAGRGQNALRRLARRLDLTPVARGLARALKEAPSGARVLDVGCGAGALLQVMARLNPGAHAVGVDLGLPPQAGDGTSFLRGRAEALPFRAGEFGVVACTHVLEHSREPYAIAAELTRVCAPGGWVYLETPSARAATLPFGTFWDDATHVRPYTPAALAQILEAQGLLLATRGHKYSLVAALLGLPYMLIGSLLGDPRARALWPVYTLGFNAFALARKPRPGDSP